MMSWLREFFNCRTNPDTPTEKGTTPNVTPSPTSLTEQWLIKLDDLNFHIKHVSNVISNEVYSRLMTLLNLTEDIIYGLKGKEIPVELEVLLTNILTDYVSTPLNIYVQLDPKLRVDGSIADLKLLEQYDIIEKKVRGLDWKITNNKLDELNTHARFIETRLGE